jgi:hypothetical protein
MLGGAAACFMPARTNTRSACRQATHGARSNMRKCTRREQQAVAQWKSTVSMRHSCVSKEQQLPID